MAVCCAGSGAPGTASDSVDHMEPAWPDAHSAQGPEWGLADGGDVRRSQAGVPERDPAPSPAPPIRDPLAGPRLTPHPRPDRSQSWWGHSAVTEAQRAMELDQPLCLALPRGPRGRTDSGHARQEGEGYERHFPTCRTRSSRCALAGPQCGQDPGRHCLQRGPEPGSGLARPRSTALPLLVQTPACTHSMGALRVWQLGEPAPQREGAVSETPAAGSGSLPRVGPDLGWEMGRTHLGLGPSKG